MLRKLLLATDGSGAALAAARWVAALAGHSPSLRVTALYVHRAPDPALATVPGARGVLPSLPEDEAMPPHEADAALGAAVRTLAGTAELSLETRSGAPAEEILAAAAAGGYDAVVLGRDEHLPLLDVVLVPRRWQAEPGPFRILAAVDGSAPSLAAARWAAGLAEALADARLTLVHVVHPAGEYAETGADGERHVPDVPLEWALENTAAPVLDAAVAALGPVGRRARTRVEAGPVAEGILAAAAEEGSDLVVVGRRGLGRVAGLMLGSVSERLLHLTRRPLAIVRPLGEQSSPGS
jgi:nucleotide-binding universal stress UspA family protein